MRKELEPKPKPEQSKLRLNKKVSFFIFTSDGKNAIKQCNDVLIIRIHFYIPQYKYSWPLFTTNTVHVDIKIELIINYKIDENTILHT